MRSNSLLEKICKFFQDSFVQYRFIYPNEFRLQIIHYDLPSSQPLLFYGNFFSYPYFMRLRGCIICVQLTYDPLYREMNPLTLGLVSWIVLNIKTWIIMLPSISLDLFILLELMVYTLEEIVLSLCKEEAIGT